MKGGGKNMDIITYNKTNKIISLILLFLIIFMQVINFPIKIKAYTEGVDGITLTSSSSSLSVGDKVEVIVSSKGQAVGGVAGILKYDTTIFKEITDADIQELTTEPWTKMTGEDGGLYISVTAGMGKYYTGNLFKITFTVEHEPEIKQTTIQLTETEIAFQDLSMTGSGGIPLHEESVTVKAASIKSTLTVNPNEGTFEDGGKDSKNFEENEGETIDIPIIETTPNGNRIQYNANGGTVSTIGETQTTTFSGWNLSGGGSFDSDNNTYTFGNEDATLTAQYTGDKITLPVPEKEGKVFTGWYTEEGERVGTEETIEGAYEGDMEVIETYQPEYTRPNAIITLTARWEDPQYTLIIDPDEGEYDGETTILGKVNDKITISNITSNPEGKEITLDPNYTGGEITKKTQTITFSKWESQDEGTFDEATNEYTFGEGDGYIIAIYNKEPINLGTPEREGYNFDGWYTAAEGGDKIENPTAYSPEENITLYAHWTIATYTITFNPDGGTVDPTTKNVTYNQPYGDLPTPIKDGYTFNGWSDPEGNTITKDTVVKITKDTTLKALWNGIEYTLTIDANEGTYSGETSIKGTKESKTTITNPTAGPNGYNITLDPNYTGGEATIKPQTSSFVEWQKTGEGTFNAETNEFTFGVGNATLTAQYTSDPVNLGTPKREGYDFNGWYTDATAGTKIENSTAYEPTSDTTLYAQWTAKKYTVIFEPDGGTVSQETKEVTYDEPYGDLPEATKTDFEFGGWIDPDGNIITKDTIVKITEDTTLTAIWVGERFTLTIDPTIGTYNGDTSVQDEAGKTTKVEDPTAPRGFRVTLNKNNGTSETSTLTQTIRFSRWNLTGEGSFDSTSKIYTFGAGDATLTAEYTGRELTLPTTLTRDGYEFDGWYTEKDGGTKIENTTAYIPTENTTLYAHWIAKQYTIIFDPTGGEVTPATKNVIYGEKYGELPTPTRARYAFEAWIDPDNNIITEDDIVKITQTTILKAKWKGSDHNLTIDVGEGSYEQDTTITKEKGEIVTIADPISPKGYKVTLHKNDGSKETYTIEQEKSFKGWNFEGEGSFDAASKKYTFGEGDGKLTATYEEDNVPLPDGDREGYDFIGWYTAATEGEKIEDTATYKPTEDVNLYAYWIPKKFTVTFEPGEDVELEDPTKEVTYDEPYGELPTPEKPGYGFDGWFNEDGEKVNPEDIVKLTEDITLYAHWTEGEFNVIFDYGKGECQGEEKVTSKKVTNEGTYGTLPIAVLEGHKFLGWYDKDNNKIEETTKVNLTSDITLYAKYDANEYKVTFTNDDGTILKEITIEHGKKAEFDGKLPTKNNLPKGYEAKFNGWENSDKLQSVTENMTVKATYTVNAIKYKISYENTKGSDNSENPTTYTIKDGTIILKNLADQGKFKFKGWYTTNDETGKKVTSIDTSELGNIKLYAQWESEDLYLSSEKYKVGEKDIDNYEEGDVYLDKIEPDTTVAEFIKNCDTNGTITVINESGKTLGDNDLVGTNMTIKVTRYDEQITMTAVVMGDIDGDGKATTQDLSELNKAYLGTSEKELTGARFKAADIDDSGVITATDLSELNRASLEISKLTYNKHSINVTML